MASCTVVQEGPVTSLAPPSPLQRRFVHLFGVVAIGVISLLGFGLLGLLVMTPPLRRGRLRRAASCSLCRRHHLVWLTTSSLLALVTLCGGVLRMTQDRQGSPRCPVSALSMRASTALAARSGTCS